MLRELPKPLVSVPALTGAQSVEVNRLLQTEYEVDPLAAIEMSGRHLAHLARLVFLKGRCDGKSVVVLAGNAYKGAITLAAARRLHQWGANIRLVLSHPIEEYDGLPSPYLERVQRQGIVIVELPSQGGHVILDGLMGLNWQGDPVGRIAELIEWANKQLTPVLAPEVPAGVDMDTGQVRRPCMRASATLALGLPKVGIMKDSARAMVGEVFLGDIGVPPALYAAPGLDLKVGAIFNESDIVRIR
jgi:NAD(P)H-hydrate epimerase